MAVQARHRSHDHFPLPAVGGSPFLLDEYAGCCVPAGTGDTTLLGDFPGRELTCNSGFVPRKRARVADAGSFCFLEDQRVELPGPAVMLQGQVQVPVPVTVGDVQSRGVCSGAASTSRRASINGPTLDHHGSSSSSSREIDALIRLECERMRAGLESARRRHARALLAAVGRAATARARAAEAELERAVRRNAELEEKARQVGAECEAWMGVARSHEAVAAGLRAALEQLLHPLAVGGTDDAEDARSCCFDETPAPVAVPAACRSCGGGEARVLVLPCRHLCLCRACEAAVDACPVCAAAKNAALLVRVS